MQQDQNQDKKIISYLEQAILLHKQNCKTQSNIILIGPTGSGKSTLSNCLINNEILLFQRDKKGNFYPIQNYIQKNTFEISLNVLESQTKDPQCFHIDQEYSIWDLPGFGDSRSIEIDINTTICANTLFNSGKQTLIILLIQKKLFLQEKLKKLVETLNNIENENVSILLIITKTEEGEKINDFISIIQQLINNQETKMEDLAKQLLKEIINKQQILILKRPYPTENDPKIFELDQRDLNQIKQKIKDKNLYKQLRFTINFSQDSKEYLEQILIRLKKQIQEQSNCLMKSQTKLKLSQIIDFSKTKDLHQNQQEQIISKEKFKNNVQTYNTLGQLLQYTPLSLEKYDKICKIIDKFFDSIKHELNGQELYIGGILGYSSQIMKIYQNYQEEKIKIKTIFIYFQSCFTIDQDVILPGINLFIMTQAIQVLQQFVINLKGNKGDNIPKAKIINNILPQSLKGFSGENSGSLYIDAQNSYNLELLTINLSGGDGGDGQDGADGEDGKDGDDGNYQMVYDKDPGCDFHFEEEPFNVAEVFLTFNRSFKCFYKSQGKCGSIGGNSRKGGLGGCVGQKGLSQFNISEQAFLNIIDTQSEQGEQGQDGEPGKGGKKGRDFVGIEQQTKIFGRTRDLKNLEKKQDNLVEGAAGNIVTQGIGTAAGVGFVQGLKVVAEEFAALSLGQVLKGATVGVTSAAFFAVTLGVQIVGTGIQILHSDHEWIEPPHSVDNDEYAVSGQVMDNDTIIEQKDIDAQIQQQTLEFQVKICKFNKFQREFDEFIRKEYPIQELHESLFGDAYQETAK